jgi:hypothetical protein
VNPLGVIADRVAGLSATWILVSWTVPVLQTFPVIGTVTTQPALEHTKLLSPGLAQCLVMLTVELTVSLHVADAVFSEFITWLPKLPLAVAVFVNVSAVESNTTE